jgi:hypothetical protein
MKPSGEIGCLPADSLHEPLSVRFLIQNLSLWRRKPMITTATHDEHYNEPALALFMAFGLREKSSNLGLTDQPR